MITFADLKTELTRITDDTSISSANLAKYTNEGYRFTRKKIVQMRPHEFESAKTSITITSGIGPLPADFLYMAEVQDSNEITLPQLRRNISQDSATGSSPLYWYMTKRSASAGHTRQIAIKPLISTTIYVYYIPLAPDIDGTSGELIDLPDEEAQHIALVYSSYLYYRDKRRWGDAGNALKLFSSMLSDYLDEFTDDEEEFIDDGNYNLKPRFHFSN